jgi:hypothetical protein
MVVKTAASQKMKAKKRIHRMVLLLDIIIKVTQVLSSKVTHPS